MTEKPTVEKNTPILRKWWDWTTKNWFLETPVSEAELTDAMRASGRPVFAFYLLLGLAVTIASCGLLANSGVTIIGAMIIAPLMRPILALSYSAGKADWRDARTSLFTLVSGMVLIVLFAYLGTKILGLRSVGSEILGRTQPTLLDLVVAIAAGTAAAFANSRKSIANTLPGTAIAVSLVPPLCVVGIGLGIGGAMGPNVNLGFNPLGPNTSGYDIALGASILFLANLAGIILASEIVFILHGYGTLRKGLVGLAITLLCAVLLALPLRVSFSSLLSRDAALEVASSMSIEASELDIARGRLLDIRVQRRNGVLVFDLKLITPEALEGDLKVRAKAFRDRVSEKLGEEVTVDIEVIVVPIQKLVFDGAEKSDEIKASDQ